jgi:AcrR family transcriptional regulator
MDRMSSNGTSRGREQKSARIPAAATGGKGLGSPTSLSPTGKRILAAARRVLARGGYEALSIKAIAEEAGEQRSSIAYHFGDKAGLVIMLQDSLVRDLELRAPPKLKDTLIGEERIRAYLKLHRRIAIDSRYWRTFFGLVPHMLHDRRLHARAAEMMDGYYRNSLRSLGLESGQRAQPQMEIAASLALAVLEGFALQYHLHPKDFDMDARFELWESLFTPLVLSLLEQAQGEGDSS